MLQGKKKKETLMTSSPCNPTAEEIKQIAMVMFLMEQSEMENTIFDRGVKKLYNFHYTSDKDNYLR